MTATPPTTNAAPGVSRQPPQTHTPGKPPAKPAPAVPASLQAAADAVTNQRKQMLAVNRQIANSSWTDKSLTPAERQAFTDWCRAFGLNPALGHVELLGGRPYVTRAGLFHKLNTEGLVWEFEGGAVREDDPDHEFWCEKPGSKVWRAKIVAHKKSDPEQKWTYTDFGVAHASEFTGPHKEKIRAPQMAKKRAEHRAMRSILALEIPTVDELVQETFVNATFGVVPPVKVDDPLGEIPLDPPAATRIEPPAALGDRVLALAAEADVKVEALFERAGALAGRQVGSTRELAELPDVVLGKLVDELEGRGDPAGS